VVRIAEVGRSRSRVGAGCDDVARRYRGCVRSTFVDNFKPAVAEPAQGVGMATIFLAVMLVVKPTQCLRQDVNLPNPEWYSLFWGPRKFQWCAERVHG
jgi:hypothetical protein